MAANPVRNAEMTDSNDILVLWLIVANGMAFLLFGWDKWRAVRTGRRVPELLLVFCGALGGWPGGLIGMIVFRHKISKGSFQLKYAAGLLVPAVSAWGWWTFRGG